MNQQIWIATLLYGISLIFLLLGLYGYLDTQGFSKENFLIASALFMLIGILLGYILNAYILSQQFRVDENLLHLTKEILHELNIPLATIQANSSLLKRSLKDNEKSLKRLERIDSSTKRLERLYAELVYSIKKEIHTIEKESFPLEQLIAERVEAMKLLNRNPFIVQLESHSIKVDKIGFEKMLDNILANAMKYSLREQPIEVRLKKNVLSIEDHGIGMDETELVTIYERYYQLDNAAYGEGIGLALVKAYCDDEKIKIRITSTKGEGTTVSFDLTAVLF
ncbi:HAMP domain-containing histidine kinase [bacterium]|nr:HAMP domain-containing histidine kinase [bacterium]MBU1956868.1 HAMP domain-containing histidine kinase [bacterium]